MTTAACLHTRLFAFCKVAGGVVATQTSQVVRFKQAKRVISTE